MLAWELESDPDLRDAVKDVRTFKKTYTLSSEDAVKSTDGPSNE
jgi:hypothetical protein